MGDRANVFFPERGTKVQDNKGVYLYTHWNGYNLPFIVKKVLTRKARWNDQPYLARMVFGEMIKENPTEETGYGISSQIEDNEYKIVVLDCQQERMCFARVGWDEDTGRSVKEAQLSWIPFDQFIGMNDEAIRKLYQD